MCACVCTCVYTCTRVHVCVYACECVFVWACACVLCRHANSCIQLHCITMSSIRHKHLPGCLMCPWLLIMPSRSDRHTSRSSWNTSFSSGFFAFSSVSIFCRCVCMCMCVQCMRACVYGENVTMSAHVHCTHRKSTCRITDVLFGYVHVYTTRAHSWTRLQCACVQYM